MQYSAYLAIYPNNIPITIVTYYLLKLASFLRIPLSEWIKFLQVCNAFAVSLGIYYGYKLVGKISDWKKSGMFVLLCLINPVVYCYAPWYYTGTMSIPFLMAGVYYACCFSREKKYRYVILSGLVFYIGIRIRVTVAIGVIALLIYWLLCLIRKGNIDIKSISKNILITGVFLVLFSIFWGNIEKEHVCFDYQNQAYPAIHWLMMSSHGEGGYDVDDCKYTESFATKEEKRKADKERWKQYVSQMTFSDKNKLALKKMIVTWAVGNDAMQDDLERCETYGRLHEYVSGNNRDIMGLFLQSFRVLTLFFMFIGAMTIVKNQFVSFSYVNYLVLVGGILFYIFWEASAEYSIGFFVFMIIGEIDGIEYLERKMLKKEKVVILIPTGIIISQIVVIGYLKFIQNINVEKYYHYAAVQANYEDEQVLELQKGDWCKQSFYAEHNFSKVGIKCYNANEECKGAAYEVILEKNGVELANSVLSGDALYGKDYWKMIVGDQESGEYDIVIKNLYSDKENRVEFCNAGTEYVDMYKKGFLLKNGVQQNYDLTFMVYRTEDVIIGAEKIEKLLMLNIGIYMVTLALHVVWYRYRRGVLQI